MLWLKAWWQGKHQHSRLPDSQSESPNTKRIATQVFASQALRWVLTLAISISIVATLKSYREKDNFDQNAKQTLNAVITILMLLFGLSFFDAYRDLAKVWRWHILQATTKGYRVETVNRIIGLGKLKNVVWLACSRDSDVSLAARAKFLLLIIVFLASQVSVALINLAYEINDGVDYTGTYTVLDDAKVANLSCYLHQVGTSVSNDCPIARLPQRKDFMTGQATIQSRAHDYGLAIATFNCTPYERIEDIWATTEEVPYFCRREGDAPEFTHRFLQYNPQDRLQNYPLLTNRTISARSNTCLRYNVTGNEKSKDRWTHNDAINYTYSDKADGSPSGWITIPTEETAFYSTTYIYPGLRIPQLAEKVACGPRCLAMWVYKGYDADTKAIDAFFQCNITVDEMRSDKSEDLDVPEFQVSNDVARIAIASIALQGRWTVDPDDEALRDKWVQRQLFPIGDDWDLERKSADDTLRYAGNNMAEYAIRSLAAMSSKHLASPLLSLSIPAQPVPVLGSSVTVFWTWVWLLFALIVFVHLALASTTVWVSRRVEIPQDTGVNMGHILQPLLVANKDESESAPVSHIQEVFELEGSAMVPSRRFAYRDTPPQFQNTTPRTRRNSEIGSGQGLSPDYVPATSRTSSTTINGGLSFPSDRAPNNSAATSSLFTDTDSYSGEGHDVRWGRDSGIPMTSWNQYESHRRSRWA